TFTTNDALRFVRRCYRPDKAVFFVYGDIDFKRLIKTLKNADLPEKSDSQSKPNLLKEPESSIDQTITHHRGTHQAHVMIGTRGYRYDDPRRLKLYLLNNIIGGPGMNARLNLSLRERRGLVYTVESTMVCYGDTGLWSIYFGCDHHDVKRCLRLVRTELDRMMQKPLSARQLSAAKRQLKGQIAIACDNREQFALDFGKSYLHHGQERNLEALYRHIDTITAEEILQTACELFAADRLTTLIFK
ncbi:MAG: insulinase family protein, partial [Prevotella sp.]|nr:insulinase family protein [Prevotella sp.]